MTRTYDEPHLADLDQLVKLIETARTLTEPDDVNSEYVRGQVNLIYDYAGLPGDAELYDGMLTNVITHRISVPEFLFQLGSAVMASDR